MKTLASGLGEPFGIAIDGSGNIYVADLGAQAIEEIVAVNGAHSPVPHSGYPSGHIRQPILQSIQRCGGRKRRRFLYGFRLKHDGQRELWWWSFSLSMAPFRRRRLSLALSNSFQDPHGVAVDASGNVYVGNFGDAFISELVAVSGAIPASPTIRQLGSGLNEPSSIAVDGSGNIYVADNTLHTIVEMLAVNGSVPTSPAMLTLGSVSNPWGVAFDHAGNVYASDVNNNVVSEIFPNGSFGSVSIGTVSPAVSAVFSFSGSATLGSTAVLTTGVSGLDFADAGTGTCSPNHSYTSGQSCKVDVQFTPSVSGPRRGAVELIDGSGNVLATGFVQGVGSGPQVTFGPGLQSTLLSGLSNPVGMAVDAGGNLFVADQYNSAVKEILATGGYTTVNVLGSGFNQPGSVAVDSAGNIFVADTLNNSVKEILAAGGYTTVNTLAAGFNRVWGIAVDGTGNVFVADNYAGAVDELTIASGYATVTPLSGYSGSPQGIVIDANQNIYVTDTSANSIVEIPAAGGYSTSNTLATGLNDPTAIALDASGNLYVADTNNSRIVELLAVGGYATVVPLGSGFDHPQGIVADGRGNIFLTDTGNGNIVELDVADPPSISFASTTVNSTSIDSPHTVQLANIGNQTLTFTGLVYPTDFPLATGDSNACTSTASLTAGQQCDLPISFSPLSAGPLADNSDDRRRAQRLRRYSVDWRERRGRSASCDPLLRHRVEPCHRQRSFLNCCHGARRFESHGHQLHRHRSFLEYGCSRRVACKRDPHLGHGILPGHAQHCGSAVDCSDRYGQSFAQRLGQLCGQSGGGGFVHHHRSLGCNRRCASQLHRHRLRFHRQHCYRI